MKGIRGSFTVEISMIMMIFIPVLVCLIYTGFYMHDRAFLEGAALEVASAASLNAGEENQSSLVEEKRKEFLTGRLLGTRDVSGTVDLGSEQVLVNFSGNFRMPGMLAEFMGGGEFRICAEAHMSLKNPKKTVNKIHSLSKLVNQAGGQEDSE